MYRQPEVLTAGAHQALSLTASPLYSHAAHLVIAPLLAEEVHLASSWYPIVFNLQGPRCPLALLGLGDTNRYITTDGRWSVPYIPAFVRRYPFTLGQDATQPDQLHLTIDRLAPHFAGQGEPLFDTEGQPTAVVKNALDFLKVYQLGSLQTEALNAALFEAGVVVAKTLNVGQGRQLHAIGGFATVDEAAFQALPDATLAAWARSGLLATVYAHWASLRHLQALVAAEARPAESLN